MSDSYIAYGHIAEEREYVEKTVALAPEMVEQTVREYFADIPIMAEIARCESTYRHYLPDGKVLRGKVDDDDTGVMQINTRYHQQKADQLGLDLTNIYDNMAYARDLYERQGTQPWSASAPCWKNHVATAM